MTNETPSIGEVIESSTSLFIAEAVRGAEAPALGSWVRIEDGKGGDQFAVVCRVEQGHMMPGRRVQAYGKTLEELREELPHVPAMLHVYFYALPVAHRLADGRIRQTLPSHPAQLHQFVRSCSDADVTQIKPPFDFLRSLTSNPDGSVSSDDLLVAVLRHMHRAAGPVEGRTVLLEAGKMLSRLLRDDHERLQSIFRRVA